MGARAGGAGGGAAGHAPTGGAHRGGHRQPGGVPPSRPSPAGRRCARACPGAARGAPGGHHAPGEPGAQVRAVLSGQHTPTPSCPWEAGRVPSSNEALSGLCRTCQTFPSHWHAAPALPLASVRGYSKLYTHALELMLHKHGKRRMHRAAYVRECPWALSKGVGWTFTQ